MLTLTAALTACGAEEHTRPLEWSYIHPAIIVPNCATARCHSAMTKAQGINLEDRRSACATVIGNVDDALLQGRRNDVERMPPDQPLPDVDIDLILRWLDSRPTCVGE